ncbi:hypothetical protein LCGC14_3085090 [marine sediment metagenome]|uniref:Uncharacterized protein n=1 Tax=marine sediment metagenome TaxID=412755 RepID=A0A0F8WCY5_9ZZZZ
MSEGITFDPMGTVTITLEDKAYVLGRPKLRQYRHHRDEIRTLAATAVTKLEEMQTKLETLKEDGPAFEKLTEKITEVSRNSFLLTSVPWLISVFKDLGDPLPDDWDEWPAWLAADQTIPTQIIDHWRTVPLAPGAKGTN